MSLFRFFLVSSDFMNISVGMIVSKVWPFCGGASYYTLLYVQEVQKIDNRITILF